MRMSEASDATTEQYFSRERSIARRALPSSAPSPVTVNTKCSAMKRRGCSARRVPCTSTSSPRSATRCFWRISTTSDAVQVAAATSNSSTGDAATALLPSTTTGGRPGAPASNSRASRQRVVISATFAATSVPPPRRESRVQAVVAEPTHAVVFEQPVEGGAIVQLHAHDHVEPHVRTIGIGTAAVVPHQAEAAARVRRGGLSLGEPVEPFQAADVAVDAVEHADLARRTEPEATGNEIAGVERHTEHQLRVAGEVDPTAHAEPEQPQPRAALPGRAHGRGMELLRRERHGADHASDPESYPRGPQRTPQAPHHIPLAALCVHPGGCPAVVPDRIQAHGRRRPRDGAHVR